jgi:hypothetical protein
MYYIVETAKAFDQASADLKVAVKRLGFSVVARLTIAVHWGILRHLRQEIGARSGVLIGAIVLDLIVVTGFMWINISGDLLVVGIACVLMLAILTVEVLFLRHNSIVPK